MAKFTVYVEGVMVNSSDISAEHAMSLGRLYCMNVLRVASGKSITVRRENGTVCLSGSL